MLGEGFPAKLRNFDILVAGRNFGCGSAREQASTAIKGLGIKAVVAASFARTFYRNAINDGLPIVECPALYDAVTEGDEISIDLAKGVVSHAGQRVWIPGDSRFGCEDSQAGRPGELSEVHAGGEQAVMRTLTLFCALIVAQALVPADAAADTQAGDVAAPASGSARIPKADVRKAISQIRRAWGSDALCWDVVRCAAYFSSFGAALTFNDGTMVPLAHEQRLSLSGHDCIQEARAALHEGNRALAVQMGHGGALG